MQALRDNYQRFISLKLAKKIILSLVIVLFFDFFLYATPVMASGISDNFNLGPNLGVPVSSDTNTIDQLSVVLEQEIQPVILNNLPENPDLNVAKSSLRLITAYNSEVGQTDDSPCITANGYDVCQHGVEDTVAANFLPFGTKIKIPELFGNKVFVVRDRMNQRYTNRLDIWMVEKQDAKQFGVKLAKIQILE